MSDDADLEFSPRGFAQFGELEDAYATKIRVYESSAASGPHVWVSLNRKGVQGIDDQQATAHLSMEQASQLVNMLLRSISYANSQWSGSEQDDEETEHEEPALLAGHELVHYKRERWRSVYGNTSEPYTEVLYTCSCGKVPATEYGYVWNREDKRKAFTQHLLEELGANFSGKREVSPP